MKKGRVLLFLVILIAAVYAVYQYTPLVRGNGIFISVDSPKAYYSSNKDIVIHVKDRYAPLKQITVKIVSLNTDVVLFKKTFTEPFLKSFDLSFRANKVVPEGKATFVVEVEDYSKGNYLNGFKKTVSFPVIVDSTPPKVILLSGTSRITIGGSALAVYYVKDENLSRVYLTVRHDGKEYPFRAYKASSVFSDPNVYLSFFTYELSKLRDYSTDIHAIDKAGNETIVHIPVYYNRRPIRKSKINITDSFIKTKVWTILQREGIQKKENLIQDFLYVNRKIREKNTETIRKICSNSEPRFLWKGRFLQLKDSKVTAKFNDERLYYYKGELKDTKFHKGYDLASIRNARVNAANSGKVVFEGYLGVYGNTIIIDHGFGVFSLYGHLQSFLVKEGDFVKRGQYIAITDTTGLAGGDHLHFDIIVDGYYVDPIEWWDRHWIKTHIYKVIDESKTRLSLLSQ
ncbi:M23 family metallopeptidase [Hippea sp. KM1]|uniref:M23 family metallopeptidase n=1 Tax=Hippea sp. KM1 TaxID=944481 RepID=UPI00046CE33A|nr:M23 family metallopeptidase [Hippea sp. KM1]